MRLTSRKRVLALTLLVVFALAAFATGVQAASDGTKEKVTLRYPTYRVGTHVAAAAEAQILKEFNELYGDEINLVVEELPGDAIYLDKIRVLATANDLPDVVDAKQGLYQVIIDGGMGVPLNEYLEADPQWVAELGEGAIKNGTHDGTVWNISDGGRIGVIYYNKEHFADAGIKPAETWEEFWDNCEKLKAAGHVPLAMMTGENSHCALYFLSARIASSDAGEPQVNSYVTDFNTPEFRDGFETIKRMLLEYSTADAIGANYVDAANHFLQEEASMIVNGNWMIPDFYNTDKAAPDFPDKVGASMFPEQTIMKGYNIGYMLTAKGDEAHMDAALKFFKFLTGARAQEIYLELGSVLPLTDAIQPTEQLKQGKPILMDVIGFGDVYKHKFPSPSEITAPVIVTSWRNLWPELVYDKITAEEMALKLNELEAQRK